ncbi:hypothetical protein COOONC_01837 [Cooperia oncophora]
MYFLHHHSTVSCFRKDSHAHYSCDDGVEFDGRNVLSCNLVRKCVRAYIRISEGDNTGSSDHGACRKFSWFTFPSTGACMLCVYLGDPVTSGISDHRSACGPRAFRCWDYRGLVRFLLHYK